MAESLPRRVYGTETEYGCLAVIGEGPPRRLRHAAVGIVGEAGPWLARHEACGFVINGARIYRDAGDHPEYATPETLTLPDAVAHDKAGDRVMAELARRWQRRAQEVTDEPVVVQLVKNNTDTTGTRSFGYHENYLVARHAWAQMHRLAGLLATRALICGAGRVCPPDGRFPAGFSLTQRVRFLCQLSSLTTTDGSRGLLNERDEAHADRTRYGRLHVISGDANRAQWSTWLKLGVVALALRILEADPTSWPDGCGPEHPLHAAFVADADVALSAQVGCRDGRERTALDIQRCYRDAVTSWASREGLPDDEASVLDAWSEALEDLSVDVYRCADRIDWVAKRWLIDTRGCADMDERHRVDLGYHRLGKGDLAEVLERRRWLREVVSDEAIAAAMHEPPPTRAAGRAAAVRAIAAAELDHSSVDWAFVGARRGTEYLGGRLDDPFDAAPAGLDEVLGWLADQPLARVMPESETLSLVELDADPLHEPEVADPYPDLIW